MDPPPEGNDEFISRSRLDRSIDLLVPIISSLDKMMYLSKPPCPFALQSKAVKTEAEKAKLSWYRKIYEDRLGDRLPSKELGDSIEARREAYAYSRHFTAHLNDREDELHRGLTDALKACNCEILHTETLESKACRYSCLHLTVSQRGYISEHRSNFHFLLQRSFDKYSTFTRNSCMAQPACCRGYQKSPLTIVLGLNTRPHTLSCVGPN